MASGGVLRRAAQRILRDGSSRVVAGQPTPATHPQLLKLNEVTPGITASEFAQRRATLAASLPVNSFAILPAAPLQYMSGVIPHSYRQEADFAYLTGVQQSNTLAVVESSCRGGTFTLFVPDDSSTRSAWDTAPVNCEAACQVFGADEALPMSQLGSRLQHMVATASTILCDTDRTGGTLQKQAAVLDRAVQLGQTKPLRDLMHRLRWVKSDAELGLMQASAATAAGALRDCITLTRPGLPEHHLAAIFEHRCKMAGAQRMSFPSVVAGGPDSCIVHYLRNDKLAADGQLMLMDAGCERHSYASDVTRCWPVNGRFSHEQAAVYEVVQDVHRQCVNYCTPGHTLRQLHHLSIGLLSQGMADLGLCGRMSAAAISQTVYSMFYPHSVGHYLGGDTHDTPSVGHDKPFEPGVVLAVEPALYIPNDPDRFGRLAGIGIRIEDDVAVTAGQPEVLSKDVPVAMKDIEELVGTALDFAHTQQHGNG